MQMVVGIISLCYLLAGAPLAGTEISMSKMSKENTAEPQKKCGESSDCPPPKKEEKCKQPSPCEECRRKPNQSKCKSAARKVVEGP